MTRSRFFASLILSLWVAGATATAQGVGASGDIKGSVTDPMGAVVTQATVTVTDTEKGIKRCRSASAMARSLITALL